MYPVTSLQLSSTVQQSSSKFEANSRAVISAVSIAEYAFFGGFVVELHRITESLEVSGKGAPASDRKVGCFNVRTKPQESEMREPRWLLPL